MTTLLDILRENPDAARDPLKLGMLLLGSYVFRRVLERRELEAQVAAWESEGGAVAAERGR